MKETWVVAKSFMSTFRITIKLCIVLNQALMCEKLQKRMWIKGENTLETIHTMPMSTRDKHLCMVVNRNRLWKKCSFPLPITLRYAKLSSAFPMLRPAQSIIRNLRLLRCLRNFLKIKSETCSTSRNISKTLLHCKDALIQSEV